MVDEYLAVRIVRGRWPTSLPAGEELVLPAIRHWRLLQRIHSPGTGQLSQILASLSPSGRDALRYPHPEVLHVADSRPLLDEAAQIAALHGGGWLVCETLAAGLTHGAALWFGLERNVGRQLGRSAEALGIAIHVITE